MVSGSRPGGSRAARGRRAARRAAARARSPRARRGRASRRRLRRRAVAVRRGGHRGLHARERSRAHGRDRGDRERRRRRWRDRHSRRDDRRRQRERRPPKRPDVPRSGTPRAPRSASAPDGPRAARQGGWRRRGAAPAVRSRCRRVLRGAGATGAGSWRAEAGRRRARRLPGAFAVRRPSRSAGARGSGCADGPVRGSSAPWGAGRRPLGLRPARVVHVHWLPGRRLRGTCVGTAPVGAQRPARPRRRTARAPTLAPLRGGRGQGRARASRTSARRSATMQWPLATAWCRRGCSSRLLRGLADTDEAGSLLPERRRVALAWTRGAGHRAGRRWRGRRRDLWLLRGGRERFMRGVRRRRTRNRAARTTGAGAAPARPPPVRRWRRRASNRRNRGSRRHVSGR